MQSQNTPDKLNTFIDLSHFDEIAIQGPDAQDFLQRMSTVDFRNWQSTDIKNGAFLTGRGQVICLGQFHGDPKDVRLILSPGQKEGALKHLEMFHFSENLTLSDTGADVALVGVWNGPESLETPAGAKTWKDARRPLTWIRLEKKDRDNFLQTLEGLGLSRMSSESFEQLRIAFGVPEVGKEILVNETLILEAGFDEAVARNKGCYPGQEVVERIFTYGSVNQKLLPLRSTGPANKVQEIFCEGKTAGRISYGITDDKGHWMGLGMIKKTFWDSTDFKSTDGVSMEKISR